MAWDGVYVPTDRAPDPGAPGQSPDDVDGSALHDVSAQGTVFVPTQRMRRGDAEFLVEMRHLQDGRLALLTYSSLDALVEGCGDAQPWVEVPAERVEEIRDVVGAEVVVMDQALDAAQRHEAEDIP